MAALLTQVQHADGSFARKNNYNKMDNNTGINRLIKMH